MFLGVRRFIIFLQAIIFMQPLFGKEIAKGKMQDESVKQKMAEIYNPNVKRL